MKTIAILGCVLATWFSPSVAVGAPLAYALNLASGPQFGTLDLLARAHLSTLD